VIASHGIHPLLSYHRAGGDVSVQQKTHVEASAVIHDAGKTEATKTGLLTYREAKLKELG